MEDLFIQNITVNTDINTPNSNRVILKTNIPCEKYNNDLGIKVQIGQTTSIYIPYSMLVHLVKDAIQNNRIYNRSVFNTLYPRQCKNHPCHVHVVGMILVRAGIANRLDSRNYKIH